MRAERPAISFAARAVRFGQPRPQAPRIYWPDTLLNAAQTEFVFAQERFIHVIAGAGSGKSEIIAQRTARLARELRSTRRIAAIAFNVDAVANLKRRLQRITPELSYPWIMTLHQLGLRLIRFYPSLCGLTPEFGVATTQQQHAALKSACITLGIDAETKMPDLLARIHHAKALYQHEADNETRPSRLHSLIACYDQTLRKNNLVELPDLYLLPTKIAATDSTAARHYRGLFKHLIIDEYQDLNTAQHRLRDILIGPNTAHAACGDDWQTIYTWIGAEPASLQDFANRFPKARRIVLTENYRSTAPILNLANAVGARIPGGIPKTLTSPRAGAKPRLITAHSPECEAEWICQMIKQHQTEGIALHDMRILTRVSRQSHPIEIALARHHIPFTTGPDSFFADPTLAELLATLALISNTHDRQAFRIFAASEPSALSNAAIEEALIFSDIEDVSPVTAAEILIQDGHPEFAPVFENRLQQLRDWRKVAKENPHLPSLMDTILQVLDPDQDLETLNDIKALSWKVPNLRTLIRRLTPPNQSRQADHIRIRTFHSAKGDEGEVVFLPGFQFGLMPLLRKRETAEQAAEEIRLGFVALSRAKTVLYLSQAIIDRKSDPNAPELGILSPLLRNLPGLDDLLEMENLLPATTR